ncbi:hypothetical protein CSKR_109442 [Clonorchis sinensis]|uniref:Uncharacterized protein n=2 Tax=Clonorchis sinensis TaxID=79923 RepID=G7YHV1_CLOSI|nr:hypothetical protein CSKR_109442 [Clonorchis sinensis]GAA52534.1 hypothetical protein CLF_108277 [Clonorchis sinensis]
MLDRQACSAFPTIRSMLESVLTGSVEGDIFRLKVTLLEHSRPSEDSSSFGASAFDLTIRMLHVHSPPTCPHNQSVRSAEQNADDPLSNPTSDWNPDLARFWYYRACFLKQRGNWLIQKHSERQGTDHTTNSSVVWASAFKCYSRGLQLATLARKAYETCAMTDTLDRNTSFVAPLCPQTTLKEGGDENAVLSLDHPVGLCIDTFESDGQAVERLEFSLLLNLALCQLKAGSAYSAAHNCTRALRMDPGWVKLAQSEAHPNGSVGMAPDAPFTLSNQDVAKTLYRRAQSYVAVSKWEEAVSDLELAIRLQKFDSAKTGLALSEALLSRARQKMSQDDAKLAERLRNRRGLF